MNRRYWMKQSKQENLIYLAVWGLLFAAPLLSLYVRTVSDPNVAFDWTEVLLVWRKFAVFLLLVSGPGQIHGHGALGNEKDHAVGADGRVQRCDADGPLHIEVQHGARENADAAQGQSGQCHDSACCF